MDRRRFLLTSLAGVVAPIHVHAQQTTKMPRVGLLLQPIPGVEARRNAFRQGLQDLGLIEGQSIIVEERHGDGSLERHRSLAVELVQRKVDVIVAPSNTAIVAAMGTTSTIPIVMVVPADPVGQGFIRSFQRPGGNITGLAWDAAPEITEKYLQFLKEVVPRLALVGGLLDTDFPGLGRYRTAAEAAAPRLGLRILHVDVRIPDQLESGFMTIVRGGIQAVFVYGGRSTPHLREIVGLAAKHRMPAIYATRDAVPIGGLMSYGVDIIDMYRRAARYVDKLLKGAHAADLPVEQPTKYELVINQKTAKALGLTIPPSLVLQADQVIE